MGMVPRTLLLAVRTCRPHCLGPVDAHRPHLVLAFQVHACVVSNKICSLPRRGALPSSFVGAFVGTTNIVGQDHR